MTEDFDFLCVASLTDDRTSPTDIFVFSTHEHLSTIIYRPPKSSPMLMMPKSLISKARTSYPSSLLTRCPMYSHFFTQIFCMLVKQSLSHIVEDLCIPTNPKEGFPAQSSRLPTCKPHPAMRSVVKNGSRQNLPITYSAVTPSARSLLSIAFQKTDHTQHA